DREVALSAVALDGGEDARVARIRDVQDPEARIAPLVKEVPPERQVRVRRPGVPRERDVVHVRAVEIGRAGRGGRSGRGDHRGQEQDGNRETNDGAHGAAPPTNLWPRVEPFHTPPKSSQTSEGWSAERGRYSCVCGFRCGRIVAPFTTGEANEKTSITRSMSSA